jgi:prepilin-type N-terminal cleavage/methylation domain-containing protein
MSRRRHHRPSPRRAGFTLIEMLVVLAIILVLAGLSVALIPTVGEKQRVADGASQLQSWLAYARQLARRDQRPTGIRLLPLSPPGLPNQPNFILCRQVQYVQQPDPFSGGYVGLAVQKNQQGTSTATVVPMPGQPSPDFFGGFGGFPQDAWAVQPGDYLEISGSSNLFRIQALLPSNRKNQLTCEQLLVDGQPVTTIPPTPDYRIIRQPRPKAGEAVLNLPDGVAIDLTTNGPYPFYGNPLPWTVIPVQVDILFAPDGAVFNSTSGNDVIQLWLRDTGEDLVGPAPQPRAPWSGTPPYGPYTVFNGEQALVTIYVRTGMIAGNRIDPTPDPNNPGTRYAHPYSYTLDGGPSGL